MKQLGVSSFKELIDNIGKTMVAHESLKAAPLTIALHYRPELFHKQSYSQVDGTVYIQLRFRSHLVRGQNTEISLRAHRDDDDVMNQIM